MSAFEFRDPLTFVLSIGGPALSLLARILTVSSPRCGVISFACVATPGFWRGILLVSGVPLEWVPISGVVPFRWHDAVSISHDFAMDRFGPSQREASRAALPFCSPGSLIS